MKAECVEGPEACEGPVELRPAPSGSGFSYYRCLAHQRKTSEKVQEIRNRYPDSPSAPEWFDPSYAGERWDEDD